MIKKQPREEPIKILNGMLPRDVGGLSSESSKRQPGLKIRFCGNPKSPIHYDGQDERNNINEPFTIKYLSFKTIKGQQLGCTRKT